MILSLPLYLDPGSGSFLLQLLIAGLAGAGIAIGSQWQKLKRFFSKKTKSDAPDGTDPDDEDR